MAEIHAIKAIWPKPFIEFADDNSFVNRTHYKALMRAMEKEHLRWFTETDLSVAHDDELLGRCGIRAASRCLSDWRVHALAGSPALRPRRTGKRESSTDAWDLCTLFDVNFQPKHMSVSELETRFRGLAKALYSQEETARRRKQFFRGLKSSPNRRRADRPDAVGLTTTIVGFPESEGPVTM